MDEPVVSRTKSEDITEPMRMIDHTCARIDGPPLFLEEDDTHVDGVPVFVDDDATPRRRP